MLVLSRKKNESIVINNDITIVVVEIRGDKVRLGVEAPREVPVHRREVFDAIQRHNVEVDIDSDAKNHEDWLYRLNVYQSILTMPQASLTEM